MPHFEITFLKNWSSRMGHNCFLVNTTLGTPKILPTIDVYRPMNIVQPALGMRAVRSSISGAKEEGGC